MTKAYKKKLIEVAIPLEAINAASAREKSIRHGHPSTLHLWWARRPLATCRAVLFAQFVDDPSSRVDELMADPKLRAQAEAELPQRVVTWEKSKASAQKAAGNVPKPTLEDVAVEIERKRLFAIIQDLVKWENSTNEEVLERARAEIRRSCGGELPPVYDPFSGGGSIPFEAQRLGLPAYASDLNPVAVMIGKAMIEIPPKFKDLPPIHPGIKKRSFYRNAEGLADDVKYYGEQMREKAWERIGHLYPQVDLPKGYGGGKATVIAWIWARTVPSPDPAFSDVKVPLASSFLLSDKSGRETWLEPIVDKARKTISFKVRHGGTKTEIARAKSGTKSGRANFICLMSGAPISGQYADACASRGEMGEMLLAVVAEGSRGRAYISEDISQQALAVKQAADIVASREFSDLEKPCRGTFASNAQGRRYCFNTYRDYFTDRQLLGLYAMSEALTDVHASVTSHALASQSFLEYFSKDDVKKKADEYAVSVVTYLAFAIDRLADAGSSISTWSSSEFIRFTFARQAISMTWDFAECNFFSGSTGNFSGALEWIHKAINEITPRNSGRATQHDAQSVRLPAGAVISTDPPYYDNIEYADLSDFFYVWMKKNLSPYYKDLFSFLSTPKAEELVATRYRHNGQAEAEEFFLSGMRQAVQNIADQASKDFPATIYYAFKQSEVDSEGVSSTGWATFLQALIEAGYAIVGTWPVRTERAARTVASGTNALASSVVLVCRKKEATADTITRAEFIRALKRELPPAIAELQAANIAPADMPQSAIGPGMGVFSRHKAVLEADDSAMSVKTALQLINAELDEYLGGIQGEFDADTRFAITWFEQNGMGKGDYGMADNLARARGISVDSVKHARIVESAAGKVRLLKRDELDSEWEPDADGHLTIWECLQHLVRQHEQDGIAYNTALLLKKIGVKAEASKDLAYCLYDISANKRQDAKEANAYNALIADWAELTREAASIHDTRGDGQAQFDL